ncbi:MAG: aldo/keto reductase [Thermoanaerobaculia bacterium]|nr:aldo/keto reductase [Thermoanaerobaculia bacterium]
MKEEINASASGRFQIGELEINRLGFGAMRLTGDGIWGPPENPAEAAKVLRRSLDFGIDFIDTADAYGPYVNEELIADALHPYPDHLVIATKGGLIRPGPGEWTENGRPEHLREACEGSLRRLKLERIDLYQLHRVDPEVPAEDQFGTLAELRDEGKIRYIGLSEVGVAEIETAEQYFPVATVQNKYHFGERKWNEVIDYCEERGIGFIPWNPLGAGKLESDALDRVAKLHDTTPMQIAIAWLLAWSPNMLPIPGTSRVKHLKENVKSASIELTAEDLANLDRIR